MMQGEGTNLQASQFWEPDNAVKIIMVEKFLSPEHK